MNTPPQFQAGKVSPLAPSVHPTTINWFMLDESQSPRGPLTIEELVDLAKGGRIQRSTLLWHSISSNGEWVEAERIALVANHLPQPSPPIMTPAIAVRPWNKVYKRSSGFSFSRDFVVPCAMTCSLALAYLHYSGNEAYLRTLNQLLSRSSAAPEPKRHTPTVSEGEAIPAVRNEPQVRIRKPLPSMKDELSEVPNRPSEIQAVQPSRNGNLGVLLVPEISPAIEGPINQNVETIVLSIGSGRQIVELATLSKVHPITVASVEGFTQPAIIEPSKSELKESTTTKIKPFGDDSIYLSLKRIPNERCPKVSIECKTSIDWIGGDSLSQDRLKRKRIAMMKQMGVLNSRLSTAVTEQGNLTFFVQSEGLKELDDVKAARNRILALESVTAGLRAQVASGQSQLKQFDLFCNQLNSTFGDVKIVFAQGVVDGM